MRVLLVHNRYKHYGGEDTVFDSERALLARKGIEVVTYVEHNDRIDLMSPLVLGLNAVWSRRAEREILDLLRRTRPHVVHFHNTFPLISPSGYYACARVGVPAVQTLHNFRLLCPAAILARNGFPCEDCLGRVFAWPALIHACYRSSRGASAVATGVFGLHRLLGTWKRAVHTYVALTQYAKAKFVANGLPEQRIVVKPNFICPDPGPGEHTEGSFLFVGRLSGEKGLGTVLQAWGKLGRKARLKIVGSGPLEQSVRQWIRRVPNIEYLGFRPLPEVLALMKDSKALLLASTCNESFPRVLAEAFATGLPVVASRLGGLEELIEDGRTGLHFRAGDTDDLTTRIEWLLAHPSETAAMGQRARQEYLAKYTGDRGYEMLMEVYGHATGQRGAWT